MRPSSSANAMNVDGGTGLPLRVHRASDSKPTHIRTEQHDRLVVDFEVVGADGVAQIVLESDRSSSRACMAASNISCRALPLDFA